MMDSSAMLRTVLRTIARINLNVLLGQIARPESRAAFGTAVEGESNGAVGQVELLLQFRLREIGRKSAAAHGHALQIDIHLRRVQRHARITGGRNDATPVR